MKLNKLLINLKDKFLSSPQANYVGISGIRSISDDGSYISSVQEATSNYKKFTNFKVDPRYQAILEHATKDHGQAYLEIIKKQSPELLKQINSFKENDLIGGAVTYEYKDIGFNSPSTLRYLKVASDIKFYFGDSVGDHIAEIGVGYGGQLLILDKVLRFRQYDLFDLAPVLLLASKYIESHIINSAYQLTTLNQHRDDVNYDLAISNYAFSELPSKLQLRYIDKVLSKSKRGYMTMNSGKESSAFREDKLSLRELTEHLPPFDIVDEIPLTSTDNYIIIWGKEAN
jgi:putative sugar O-methyltransferase